MVTGLLSLPWALKIGCGFLSDSFPIGLLNALLFDFFPYIIIPSLDLTCVIIPCIALPCFIIPCRALPCFIIPCLVLTYHTLPCLAFLCFIIEIVRTTHFHFNMSKRSVKQPLYFLSSTISTLFSQRFLLLFYAVYELYCFVFLCSISFPLTIIYCYLFVIPDISTFVP